MFNLNTDVAFFNAKIIFIIIILLVPSVMSAFSVNWLTERTDITRAN